MPVMLCFIILKKELEYGSLQFFILQVNNKSYTHLFTKKEKLCIDRQLCCYLSMS